MAKTIDKYFQPCQSRYLSDDSYIQFHDRDFAYTYLLNHLHDAFSMMRMRDLLADQVLDVYHMADHQVLQQFASCLVNRTVQIAVEQTHSSRRSSAIINESHDEIDDSAPTPSARIDDESVPEEQKASELETWVVTVTPAMLVAAAKDGIPFCEECARAAQSGAS